MSGRNARLVRRLAYKAGHKVAGQEVSLRVFKRWWRRLDSDGKADSRAVIFKDWLSGLLPAHQRVGRRSRYAEFIDSLGNIWRSAASR